MEDFFRLVGAGAVAAILTQSLLWLREFSSAYAATKKEAAYLALRVALVLEGFAQDCAEEIGRAKSAQPNPTSPYDVCPVMPTLKDYAADLDWRAISSSLSARALGFGNVIQSSCRSISFMWDEAPDGASETAYEELARCGLKAHQLAHELRQKCSLPPIDLDDSWDYPDFLKKERTDRAENTSGMIDLA